MADLSLDAVSKRFGTHAAVDSASLALRSGEFVALLGPSGCGKTTLLRLIAGFEAPDTGTIRLRGETIATPERGLPPEARQVAMVFQAYALWPHMSVAENVGYALKLRGLPAAARRERVMGCLETVGLGHLADRRPELLSGGQRQRVALARCLATDPSLVLLDEPLANLDAHLREEMQAEFRRLHRETGATMVYVTHDQAEAMALADRVAVMDRGVIQQVAPPRELYARPATEMVARFIGQGVPVPGRILGSLSDGRVAAEIFGLRVTCRSAGDRTEGPATIVLRPETLELTGPEASDSLAATVSATTFRGDHTSVEAVPTADPSLRLLLRTEAEPEVGVSVGLRIRDGWVLPQSAVSAEG
ncbi:ABC transporter ATP-binding protein [Algihabitans albus]|uniref:ABC transporter ATP-binding protein n=1 Tax=Algihabitans albus TaxID=2164067 RepID=UPI000E5D1A56|nr:ABC transporter ATP-binding protein [Algihabitans albus]